MTLRLATGNWEFQTRLPSSTTPTCAKARVRQCGSGVSARSLARSSCKTAADRGGIGQRNADLGVGSLFQRSDEIRIVAKRSNSQPACRQLDGKVTLALADDAELAVDQSVVLPIVPEGLRLQARQLEEEGFNPPLALFDRSTDPVTSASIAARRSRKPGKAEATVQTLSFRP